MSGSWDCIARHEGGTVVALATAPLGDGIAACFAATATGLFRSDDSGRRWIPTSETPLPLLTAVAPSAHFAENRLLFAGSHTGFYRSDNAGHTWQQMLSGGVFTIAVVPDSGREDRLFVGTAQDGILRSDDGGRTWAGANPGLLDLTILALAFSPNAVDDQTGFAATASGLYRTRNGGKSWREVALSLDELAVQCLAVSPAFAHKRLILAGTETEGLWRSDDGGTQWNRVAGVPEGGIGAIAFSSPFSLHSDTGGSIAVATDSGVALSHDDGETWEMTGQFLPPILALVYDGESDEKTLLAGRYRHGIARLHTEQSGNAWSPSNAGLEATYLTTLVASPTLDDDPTLLAAGPETRLQVSHDGGRTWIEAAGGIGEAVVHGFAIPPDGAGDLVVAATGAGIYRSRDRGETWELPTDGSDVSIEIVACGMSAESKLPFIFAATRDGRLIASDDAGVRWNALRVPIVGETMLSLACSSDDTGSRTLYVGTAGNGGHTVCLWYSDDGGSNWTCWLEERGNGTLPLVVAPDGLLFVGVGGRVLCRHSKAAQTHDWKAVSLVGEGGGIAAITALAVSPRYRTDGMVFAATSAGVYRSDNRGETFDRWSEGIAAQPMLALVATTAADSESNTSGVLVFAVGVNGAIWRRSGAP